MHTFLHLEIERAENIFVTVENSFKGTEEKKKKRILTNIADNVSRNLEDASELASKKGIGRNQGPVYQRETDDESEEAG